MKKGLSVLLIAAALFGFYGGAVNLNDVLACKDYWEEEGEKSTADMNKLEDGLNQLKDNEQAYLDGLDAVADGEQALEDGEAALAEGQATLAKGEADYAAAPGKLAEGKKSLSDLTKLINGLNKAYKSFNNYSVDDNGKKGPSWKQGFEHAVGASVLAKIAAGEKTSDSPGLKQARQVITSTVNSKKDMLNTAGSLGGANGLADSILGAKSYDDFDKAVKSGVQPLLKAADALNALSATVTEALGEKQEGFAAAVKALTDPNREQVLEGYKEQKTGLLNLKAGLNQAIDAGYITKDTQSAAVSTIPEDIAKKYTTVGAVLAYIDGALPKLDEGIALYTDPKATVAAGINGAIAELGGPSQLEMVKSLDEELYNSLQKDIAILTQKIDKDDQTFAETIGQFSEDMNSLATKLTESAAMAKSTSNTFKDWDAGYQQLKDGQDQLADQGEGIPFAFKNMMTNSTLRKALKAKVPGTYAKLAKYTDSTLAKDDMDKFDSDMKDVSSIIKTVLPVLRSVKAKGQNDYSKGLADYKAAPAKLAAGRAQLAEGIKALEDGRKELAAGKSKLAEYEDGEQQVRDGLATLMGTEPNGGLESILDRRNGDDDFDNGDKHLDLDEGLDAVDVGRGYQADSGELITKEITNRAIGTAAGLGAAALAVLAAILSFLKKNKGAGVLAILSAAAGGAGIAAGTSAGMEFSSIAGSAVGATPWIAFGILAGVAAVHAIAHFASKEA